MLKDTLRTLHDNLELYIGRRSISRTRRDIPQTVRSMRRVPRMYQGFHHGMKRGAHDWTSFKSLVYGWFLKITLRKSNPPMCPLTRSGECEIRKEERILRAENLYEPPPITRSLPWAGPAGT